MPDPYTAKQSEADACGAFALAASICDLGKQQFTGVLQFAASGDQSSGAVVVSRTQSLTSSSARTTTSDKALGNAIYAVTGLLDQSATPPLYQDSGKHRNPPSAISAVAMEFGCRAKVHVYSDAWSTLTTAFPLEAPFLQALGVPVVGDETSYARTPGVAQMILVGTSGALASHWITRTIDGKYYDPADGSITDAWKNPPPPSQLTSDAWSASTYLFAGLWIELSS